MNLVMIIQKVDETDVVFGAHIAWIKSLAAYVEKLFVIGLSANRCKLPSNVEVYSLNRDKIHNRLKLAVRFERIMANIYRQNKIDGVFIHQGQIYGPLLAPFRLLGIPVILFKAHGTLPRNIKYFLPFFDRVTTTTLDTFPIDTPKKIPVGQGIDVERFKDDGQHKDRFSIISSGRISPIKGFHVFIDAVSILKDEINPRFIFEIYGSPYLQKDEIYEKKLKDKIKNFGLLNRVFLKGAVLNADLPQKINKSIVFVDSSIATSALNKSMLEAMACEVPVITSNEKFFSLLGPYTQTLAYRCGDAGDLAEKIKAYLNLTVQERKAIGEHMRKVVVDSHNVLSLMQRITQIFQDIKRDRPIKKIGMKNIFN